MAIISLVCTRKVENTNLTFGTGKFGALTLTGEIYNCEGYKTRYVDEDGLQQIGDLSNELIGTVGSVAFEGTTEEYQQIQEEVAAWFRKKAQRNVFALKIGVVIKCSSIKLSKSVWNGEERETYILNEAEFIEVETPEIIEDAEDVVTQATSARSNNKERKTNALAGYIKKVVDGASKSLFTELSTKAAQELGEELKKETTKRGVGRPKATK